MNRRNFSKYLLLTAVKSFSWSKMTNSESYVYHSDKKKMIENTLKEYKNFEVDGEVERCDEKDRVFDVWSKRIFGCLPKATTEHGYSDGTKDTMYLPSFLPLYC